jgi:hypothetical protein
VDDEETAKWQYWVDDGVDGKKDGWCVGWLDGWRMVEWLNFNCSIYCHCHHLHLHSPFLLTRKTVAPHRYDYIQSASDIVEGVHTEWQANAHMDVRCVQVPPPSTTNHQPRCPPSPPSQATRQGVPLSASHWPNASCNH